MRDPVHQNTDEGSTFTLDAIVHAFYETFYQRSPDSAISTYVQGLTETSPQPLTDFFRLCRDSPEFRSKDSYIPLFGHHQVEGSACWCCPSAAVVVKEQPLYLSIPADFPSPQALTINDGIQTRTVGLSPGQAVKVRNPSQLPAAVITVNAEYKFLPRDHGLADARALAFQISTQSRDNVVIRQLYQAAERPSLIGIYVSTKELRVLSAVAKELDALGIKLPLYSCNNEHLPHYIAHCNHEPICLIASADAFFICEQYCDRASYIYVEHGISPFKGYTYAAHYKNYDHVMLPSEFWRDRIIKLHGELKSSDVVGYPALSDIQLSNYKDIDLLFAPTWSLSSEQTEAVCRLVTSALEAGLRVAYVSHPDSIANIAKTLTDSLIPVRDVYDGLSRTSAVITDYSSVGIEAAVLGIPVLTFRPAQLEDFDAVFSHNGKLEVPHSNGVMWDIGPDVSSENLAFVYGELIEGESRLSYEKERLKWIKLCHAGSHSSSAFRAGVSTRKYLMSLGVQPNE